METKKIYRVACGTFFEETYKNKNQAENILKIKKQTYGNDCILEEMNVIFNRDGSYQELFEIDNSITIDKTKKYLTELKDGGSKIYCVSHTYDDDGNNCTVVSEKNYVDKTYAEQMCKMKNEEIEKSNKGKYNPFKGSASVKEIDVIFNSDGSYREIQYNSEKKFPDEQI